MKIYTPDEYIAGLRSQGIVVYEMLEERIRRLNPNGIPSGCFAETDGLIPGFDIRYAAGSWVTEPQGGAEPAWASTQGQRAYQNTMALQGIQQIPDSKHFADRGSTGHLTRAELLVLIEHHADSNPARVAELAKLLRAAK